MKLKLSDGTTVDIASYDENYIDGEVQRSVIINAQMIDMEHLQTILTEANLKGACITRSAGDISLPALVVKSIYRQSLDNSDAATVRFE